MREYIKDDNDNIKGYYDGNWIRDLSDTAIGTVDDYWIRDSLSSAVGTIDKYNWIKNTMGQNVGKVEGNCIYDEFGARIGSFTGGRKSAMAAAYILLLI